MTSVQDHVASPSHELEIDPGWRAAHTQLADRPQITDWTWAGLAR